MLNYLFILENTVIAKKITVDYCSLQSLRLRLVKTLSELSQTKQHEYSDFLIPMVTPVDPARRVP